MRESRQFTICVVFQWKMNHKVNSMREWESVKSTRINRHMKELLIHARKMSDLICLFVMLFIGNAKLCSVSDGVLLLLFFSSFLFCGNDRHSLRLVTHARFSVSRSFHIPFLFARNENTFVNASSSSSSKLNLITSSSLTYLRYKKLSLFDVVVCVVVVVVLGNFHFKLKVLILLLFDSFRIKVNWPQIPRFFFWVIEIQYILRWTKIKSTLRNLSHSLSNSRLRIRMSFGFLCI